MDLERLAAVLLHLGDDGFAGFEQPAGAAAARANADAVAPGDALANVQLAQPLPRLLYTSDAADELPCLNT